MSHKHVSFTLLIAIFLALVLMPGDLQYPIDLLKSVQDFYLWVQNQGAWAPAVFILFNIVVVVFLIPVPVVTLGAGLLFGFFYGVVIVLIGTTVGALVAFNIAHYFFGERMTRFLTENPKLKTLNEEFAHDGYIFIMLTRMVPFFPFKLSNYFFGLTRFSQKHFLFGTAIGIIPITCINVYFGSIIKDIGTLVMGKPEGPATAWWVYVLGVLATLITLYYIRVHARRALMRYKNTAAE